MSIISIDYYRNNSLPIIKRSKNDPKVVKYMNSSDLRKILVSQNTTIKEAMKIMDESSKETILVIDEQQKLIGLISDGDIRRAILSEAHLDYAIGNIMNRNFTALPYQTPIKEIVRTMKKHYFKQLPLIDEERRVVDVILLKDIIAEKSRDNYIVLMAGGLGSRLRPLTDDLPKPMLRIGDKPILQIIMNQFKKFGFKNFIISINYKGDMVEGYFGDGSDFDVNIQYLRETKRLGTAGCLKMAGELLNKPFFVMNGDILTRLDFEDMLKFHKANNFDITMGVRKHEYQIPYGVINTDGNSIAGIIEKPVNHCIINAGMYCLNPEVIRHIPDSEYFDITSLIDICLNNGGKVGGYHVKDYWMDIGRIEDYNKANIEYESIFSDFSAERKKPGKVIAGRR